MLLLDAQWEVRFLLAKCESNTPINVDEKAKSVKPPADFLLLHSSVLGKLPHEFSRSLIFANRDRECLKKLWLAPYC